MTSRFKELKTAYELSKDKVDNDVLKNFIEKLFSLADKTEDANKYADRLMSDLIDQKNAEIERLKQLTTIEYSHAIPLTAHEKITAELFDTYKRKNHDYGDSFTESLNEFGLVAGLVRVGDKVNRLKSLTKNEQRVNDESLRDTILDAGNYLVMMAMWLDSEDNHG